VSDVERLRDAFARGDVLRPSTETPNTVDLALAMAAVVGSKDISLTPAARDIETQLEAEHLVVALIDGLGMNLIEEQPPDAFLRSHTTAELRAVFPSTTATALTSLATGVWPARHAIPGWWTYLPEYRLTSTVLPFIERFSERPLAEFGVDPSSVYIQPSLASSFQRDTCSFLPAQIASSAYTQYVSAGGAISPYKDLALTMDRIAQRVRVASGPTYTYFYYPVIDGLEHGVGPAAPQVRAAVRALDRQLERLARHVGDRCRLVVSADHGLTPVEDCNKHVLPADLQELLVVPPTGEPRVPYFHVTDGGRDAFASLFRERIGERFALLTVDEVDELRLFGPDRLTPTARARIGDFIGIALSQDVLLSAEMEFRGFHGALTPDEMRIPLVIA
jgi:Type I phosphodiesterase / nucleotide pyrophosphatase